MRRLYRELSNLLASVLDGLLAQGALVLTDDCGVRHHCGVGDFETAPVVRIKTAELTRRLLLNPDIAAGEGYTEGSLVIERGSLREVMELIFRAVQRDHVTRLDRFVEVLRFIARPLHQANSHRAARANIGHHYDLSPALYRDMLGPTLEYSCAYFSDIGAAVVDSQGFRCASTTDLDAAQRRKERHIADKLCLKSGMQVLDIGCGWGSLALYLANAFDVKVTGITLSREQLTVCNRRAEEAGHQDRLKFELMDYRSISSRYDRIVSVGMFEHVGAPNYPAFFKILASALEPKGVALIHTIGRVGGPGATNPWIRKHIFPGGYIPALSEIASASQRTELMIADVEVLRLHYALTLNCWAQNFTAVRELALEQMGEQFVRKWECYLVASEMAFIYGNFVNFQVQFCKDRAALPITRDYMSLS